MLELQSLSIRDCLLWRKVDFQFVEGITLVKGPNRSGKTLLMSGLPLLLLGNQGASGFGAKRGTDAARWPDSKAKMSLVFGKGRSVWAINGTSSKLSLTKDDNDLGLPGKKEAQARLSRITGLSSELYASTIHLKSTVPHPLTHASPSMRSEWLADVFGITAAYDPLFEKVSAKLAAIKRFASQAEAIRAELGSAKLRKKDAKRGLLEYARGETSESLAAKLRALRKEQGELLPLISAAGQIKELSLPSPLPSEEALEKRLDKAERLTKLLRQNEKEWDSYRRAMAAREEAMANAKRLHSSLKIGSIPASDCVSAALRRVEACLEQAKEDASTLEEINGRERPSRKGPSSKALSSKRLALAARLSLLVSSSVKVAEGERCGECGNVVTRSHLKKHGRERARKIKRLSARVERLHKAERKAEARERLLELWDSLSEAADHATHLPAMAKAASMLGRAEEDLDRAREAQQAINAVSSLKMPRKPSSEEKDYEALVAAGERDIANIREILTGLAKRKRLLATVPKDKRKLVDRVASDAAIAHKLLAQRSRLSEALDNRQAQHSAVVSLEAKLEEASQAVKRLEATLSDLKDKCGHEKEYAELRVAFGKSGLRISALESLVSAFESHLNASISLLGWPSDYRFVLSLKESGLTILLHRSGGMISDLTTLSGSEEKVWRLLCAMALIRLLPSSARCDTVILDEMEANLDDDSRARFVGSYLPELQKLVPKVVIVSPLTRSMLPVEAARILEVRPGEKGSKLIPSSQLA